MSQLKFNQQMILTLYRKFYGQDYLPDCEGNTDMHILTQKMCYLLQCARINCGSFNYIWDSFGPYSEGLQSELILLDYNKPEVELFYNERFDESSLFSDEESDGSLFSVKDKFRIEELSGSLHISDHRDNERRWVELLGSLAYLVNAVMPGADQSVLEQELLERKKDYGFQQEEIQEAWELLSESGVIYGMAS